MSAPYSAPRRLERSRSDRFIGGVCGGIAKYLNMDPTLVRILTVVITLFTFVPVVAYIIAMFVMPEEQADTDYPSVGTAGSQPTYQTYQPNGQQQTDPVWGAAGTIGIAVGPALGGLLTQLLEWQSIFILQVPLLLLVPLATVIRPAPPEPGPGGVLDLRPEVGLGLLSAGLTGALFLLVILLTEGWGLSPIAAAASRSATWPSSRCWARRTSRRSPAAWRTPASP